MLTDTEQERQEKELALARAAQVETQLRQVALNLLQTGMSISQVAQLTGLSEEQVRKLIRASTTAQLERTDRVRMPLDTLIA